MTKTHYSGLNVTYRHKMYGLVRRKHIYEIRLNIPSTENEIEFNAESVRVHLASGCLTIDITTL